jgi:hypothetical protein
MNFQGKEIKSCSDDQEPEMSFKAPVMRLYHYKEFKNGSAKIEVKSKVLILFFNQQFYQILVGLHRKGNVCSAPVANQWLVC